MAGGVAILLLFVVVFVLSAIGLALYGTGSLARRRDGEAEHRR